MSKYLCSDNLVKLLDSATIGLPLNDYPIIDNSDIVLTTDGKVEISGRINNMEVIVKTDIDTIKDNYELLSDYTDELSNLGFKVRSNNMINKIKESDGLNVHNFDTSRLEKPTSTTDFTFSFMDGESHSLNDYENYTGMEGIYRGDGFIIRYYDGKGHDYGYPKGVEVDLELTKGKWAVLRKNNLRKSSAETVASYLDKCKGNFNRMVDYLDKLKFDYVDSYED